MTETILEQMQAAMGWPDEDVIFNPSGDAAAIFVRLAKQKIGQGLERLVGRDGVDVGVLVRDESFAGTDVPLAVICRFKAPAYPELLAEAHRLAWNFCHSPILITIDPVELLAWSCFVAPKETLGAPDSTSAALDLEWQPGSGGRAINEATAALHWVSLLAGEPERLHPDKFDPAGRADQLLLQNLKAVRTKLVTGDNPLPVDQAHDLIARLMFIQFLFDRKDSSGYAVLNPDSLSELAEQGHLLRTHSTLDGVLSDYDEAYRLFRWLNGRFNGDLFPGKSAQEDEREDEWRREMAIVKPVHLTILAELVNGKLSVESGQFAMWRLYSFDAIPLEFVSSIYEEFVSAKKEPKSKRKGAPRARVVGSAHYTPAHLADYVLDAVLPWDGKEWNVRVLDPSCGSGIFLVRAFQRLIHRWRRQHAAEEIPFAVLNDMLTDCLCGVDLNPQAVRVASFSLYLAMCDEIDPKRYWTEVRLPPLRGKTLVSSDFFEMHPLGAFSRRFDVIVGNAPWGQNSATPAAKLWAEEHDDKIYNNDVGSLFLTAGLDWLADGGRLAMIQSTKAIIAGEKAAAFRSALAKVCRIEEVTNFTLLRYNLFRGATSPACCVVLRKAAPNSHPTIYICPKRNRSNEDDYRIAFDQLDVNHIYPNEISDPLVWNVLVVGGRRDVALVRKLAASNPALRDLDEAKSFVMSEGFIAGDRSKTPDFLQNRRVLSSKNFPDGTDGVLRADRLPRVEKLDVERSRTAEVFEAPQLIIKQGWDSDRLRFSSALVEGEGVVCTQSYVSIHAKDEASTRALKLVRDSVNGRLTSYFLGMTNGRMTYRPELLSSDVAALPIFADSAGSASLKEPEIALIEDAMTLGIPELLKDDSSLAWSTTEREAGGSLEQFCDFYLRVLKPGGQQPAPTATIYREAGDSLLPVRMVAIHLSPLGDQRICYENVGAGLLRNRLLELNSLLISQSDGGTANRVATIFDSRKDAVTGKVVPTVYLIRPDRKRFWSRSAALREADRLMADNVFLPRAVASAESGSRQ